MKRFSWMIAAALALLPSAAFADVLELSATQYEPLGTVETRAVTGPIEVGGITYIPWSGSAVGGAAGMLPNLGTVETLAVTGPIEVGGITYIPGDGSAVGGAAGMLPLGTVVTEAVTGPIEVGGITYVPGDTNPSSIG